MDGTSAEPIFQNEALRDLRTLLNGPRSRALALVGSGASRGSGYPDWKGLIGQLSEKAKKEKTLPVWYSVLDQSTDAAWQAEEYRQALGPELFEDFIGATFKPPAALAEPHHAIADLPFRHFLTTNYETCCEAALQENRKKRPPSLRWDQTKRLNAFLMSLSDPDAPAHVVHLHGRYDVPSQVILTEESYVRRYVESEDARRKLLAIFMTNPVVFIGFSMDDPDLSQLMREVAARARSGGRTHYAIMGYRTTDERDAITRRMEMKFGVRVVFYSIPRASEDHSNLTTLLKYLKTGTIQPQPSPPSGPPPPSPAFPAAGVAAGPAGAPPPGTPGAAPLVVMGPDEPPDLALPGGVDPNKGQFGGEANRDGLVLSIANARTSGDSWLTYDLIVEDTRRPPLLAGKVRFRLHPSFDEDNLVVPVKNGRAVLEDVGSYGAYTVGVLTEDGTPLELDLAEVDDPQIPKWFRER
jgi:hypothetical protein